MINYNGMITSSYSETFNILGRGFQYGDGIFETIIFSEGKFKFLNEHWERLSESVQELKMRLSFTKSQLHENVMRLLGESDLMGQDVRIKLYVWRKAGGLYTPTESEVEFLITAQQTNRKDFHNFFHVGIAKSVFLQKTAFSHLKTISALPYVMAGLEKKERGLEELILLDQDGFLSEASAANLYFFDNNMSKLYTPSLQTGCIHGVSRRVVFKNARNLGISVQEVMWRPEDLSSDLSVFTSNVSGINCIQKIETQKMRDSAQDLQLMKALLK